MGRHLKERVGDKKGFSLRKHPESQEWSVVQLHFLFFGFSSSGLIFHQAQVYKPDTVKAETSRPICLSQESSQRLEFPT